MLFLLASFLLYGHTLAYPFQFDDSIFLNDGNVLAGSWSRFLWPPVPRALVWVSYALQTGIHAQIPAPFRALNITLHGLNAFLLFLLLQQIAASDREMRSHVNWPGLLGALLFLIHPLQTEPVIYVYQRSTLLSSTFFLLGLLLGLRRDPAPIRQALLVLCVLAAFLSKEWTLGLPLLIWLERGLLLRVWKPTRLVLGCGALSLGAAGGMFQWMRHDPTLGSGSSWEYAQLQVLVWWKYLGLTVLPIGLNIDHSVPFRGLPGGLVLVAALALVLLFSMFLWVSWRRPGELFAVALFLLALLPTSSLIPAQDLIFEHRLYAPLAGISIWLGLFLARRRGTDESEQSARHPGGLRPLAWAGLFGLLLPVLIILTLSRSTDWRSQESLWSAAVERAPEKYRPRLNLGRLMMTSAPLKAEAHLVRAIELRPELPQAFRSLASLKLRAGDSETAASLWEQALLLEPEHALTHLALGQLRMDQRSYFEARTQFQQAIQFNPSEIRAYRALARLETTFGFQSQGLEVVDQAVALWPRDRELVRLRADILFRQQRWQAASSAVELALELGATDWSTLVLAGQIQQRLGNLTEAGSFFRRSSSVAGTESQRSISQRLLQELRQN